VQITGVRLDNLAVCEYAINYLHKQLGLKVTITAKEFFDCNEKAISGWISRLAREFPPEPPPPSSQPPRAEKEAEEEEAPQVCHRCWAAVFVFHFDSL